VNTLAHLEHDDSGSGIVKLLSKIGAKIVNGLPAFMPVGLAGTEESFNQSTEIHFSLTNAAQAGPTSCPGSRGSKMPSPKLASG